MRRVFYAVLLISWLASQLGAVAQSSSIQFSPTQQIRKGVDAWPLVSNPRNEAERKINKYLIDLNTKLFHSLQDCDSSYAQVMRNRPRPAEGEEGAKSWSQNVKVTMSGPLFVSLVATTGSYCGGAHPYGFTSVAVFSLMTGEPVDPREWFLPSLKVLFAEEDDGNPNLEKTVSVAGLLPAYREATHHECDETYPDDQGFLIWPDAGLGKVMIQADRLPGCCEACGIEAGLTLDQARKLGFTDGFLRAISEAHKQRIQH